MLRLKNIKINDGIAEADYSPEDSNWWGHIVVDAKNEEIIHAEENDEYGSSYRGHALWKLVDLFKANDKRTECTVMWY